MRTYFLTTKRIGFSNWKEADIKLAKTLWGDPQVSKYINAKGAFSNEEINQRLELEIKNQKLYDVQYWPIFELLTNKFIGCCGLRPYNLEDNIYEIGFHLKSDSWGKGLGKEAALAVIQYALQELKVDNLFVGHNPHNEASKILLEKLGFTYYKDEFYEPTQLYHPSYYYK